MSAHPEARPTAHPSHIVRPATAPHIATAGHPSRRAGHIPARAASPATAPRTGTPSRQAEHDIVRSASQTVSVPRPARGTYTNGNSKPKSAGRTLAGIYLHGLKTQ
jgi:hypothetical protein